MRNSNSNGLHLRSISLRNIPQDKADEFPFNVPLIRQLDTIELTTPVTFFVGENGCGKSTLLEATAYSAEATVVGSANIDDDQTLQSIQPLGKYLRLSWTMRTKEGFFLRAEDFFGFVKRINRMRAEIKVELAEMAEEFKDSSDFAKKLALGPLRSQLAGLEKKYGEGLDTMSHGESFLKLFQSRFVPNGVYFLDEPETPLSPLRQIALLAQIKEMVAANCQFIIATHSPILMAYPNATLLQFGQDGIRPTQYDDLEHVRLTRDFLNNPEQFLRHF